MDSRRRAATLSPSLWAATACKYVKSRTAAASAPGSEARASASSRPRRVSESQVEWTSVQTSLWVGEGERKRHGDWAGSHFVSPPRAVCALACCRRAHTRTRLRRSPASGQRGAGGRVWGAARVFRASVARSPLGAQFAAPRASLSLPSSPPSLPTHSLERFLRGLGATPGVQVSALAVEHVVVVGRRQVGGGGRGRAGGGGGHGWEREKAVCVCRVHSGECPRLRTKNGKRDVSRKTRDFLRPAFFLHSYPNTLATPAAATPAPATTRAAAVARPLVSRALCFRPTADSGLRRGAGRSLA